MYSFRSLTIVLFQHKEGDISGMGTMFHKRKSTHYQILSLASSAGTLQSEIFRPKSSHPFTLPTEKAWGQLPAVLINSPSGPAVSHR